MSVFVVTGHRRGLGHGITGALERRGHPVVGVSSAEADLADPDALATDAERILTSVDWGDAQLVGLVANAGILEPIGPLDRIRPDAMIRHVTVNLAAPLVWVGAFLRATTGVGDRRIALVSSGAARTAYSGWGPYCATKAGLDQLARVLAAEGHRNLRVEAVAPGVIDTDMQAAIRACDPADFPEQPRFVARAEAGELPAADEVGERFVDHLLSPAFGRDVVTDLRQL